MNLVTQTKIMVVCTSIACSTAIARDRNVIPHHNLQLMLGSETVVTYQASPLTAPKGGPEFMASDFIHPLKTPAGFSVTGIQPPDHLHHMGLWWPWKYVQTGDRKVLFWELQKGDGIIRACDSKLIPDGFTAHSIYIDRKNQAGPTPLINETLSTKLSAVLKTQNALGYNLDLKIIHKTAGNRPLTITAYRYSGFALRGTPYWNKNNCTVLTSADKQYDRTNNTRAKWVRIQGSTDNDSSAGVLLMSHPDNHDFPEHLRTWNTATHNGAIFVNFNPVQKKEWKFKPGKKYIRQYRVFVYDGSLTAEECEKLWQKYKHSK